MTFELRAKPNTSGGKQVSNNVLASEIDRRVKFFRLLWKVVIAPFAVAIVAIAPTGLSVTPQQTAAFTLEDFSNETGGLFAHARYSNLLSDKGDEATTRIDGVELGGAFFPNVELFVAKDRSGPWQKVESKMPNGRQVSLALPGILEAKPLKISLAAFQDKQEEYAFGKVQLPTGDALIIPFSELRRAQKLGEASSKRH